MAVALLALTLFALDWRNGLYGGVAEVGALRVMAGDLPYRDFWTIYAPGQFYLLAGFFRLAETLGAGFQWMVSPVAASTLLASACGIAFVAMRRAGANRLPALLWGAAIALAIASTPFHRSCGSYPPALLLLVGAWALMGSRGEATPVGARWAAGLCLGAAALFKHDVAAYSAIGLGIVAVAQARMSGAPWRGASASAIPMVLGALAVFLPPMAILGSFAGGDLWTDLVVFPLGDFPASRPEAFPLWPAALFDGSVPRRLAAIDLGRSLGFWLPWLAWFPAGWVAWVRPKLRPWLLGLGATFLLHMLAARVQINTHAISWTVFAGLALAPAWQRGVPVFARTAAVLVGVGLLGAHAAAPGVRHVFAGPAKVAHSLPLARGTRIPESSAKHLAALSRWIERTTPPGASIFAGARRHDILLTSPTRLYFLLGRPPAVRYQELHPAIADTAPVQREMIRDLEREQTQLVILRSVFSDAHLDRWQEELRKSVPAVGATLLDAYLACAYAEVDRLGPFEVRTRRPPPTDSMGCRPASEP